MTIPVNCPYCNSSNYHIWGTENGFNAVQCNSCKFVYVNPRPTSELIEKGVEDGIHNIKSRDFDVKSRRVAAKIPLYVKIFDRFFTEFLLDNKERKWLDVGAGYGEIIQSVRSCKSFRGTVFGVEPMKAKADKAKSRGLDVFQGYLEDISGEYDIISLINVFSHLPDFRLFLRGINEKLSPEGYLFLETGNAADCQRKDIPGILSLPDHLNFAGKEHIIGFLKEAGFEIVRIESVRVDNINRLVKNIIKKIMGSPLKLKIPYTSSYRTLLILAQKKTA